MKSIVRNNILSQLKILSVDEKKRHSQSIEQQLKNLFKDTEGLWAAYKNLSSEPDINWSEVSSRMEWLFPKVQGQSLEFRKNVTEFSKSDLGVLEPQDGKSVEIRSIDGVIIPAVAYDQKGYRLGRGKGYYDRALSDFTGRKVGVCFNMALCEELPHEAHDIKCNQIVTENNIFYMNESEGAEKWN